jgi:Skp family chaperone for outer membrane proteins
VKTSIVKATATACGLAVCLAASFCFAQGAAPRRPSGTNVAVIDVAQVFENHTRFKKRMEDIKSDIEKFEATVRQEQKRLTTLRDELQTLKPGTDRFKQIEKQLADATADVQVTMQLKRKEFLEEEAKVYYNAYQEVLAAVAQFAERNGIGLVLRFNGTEMDPTKRESVLQGVNRAVVFQRNLNITDYIIEALNVGVAPRVGTAPQIPSPRR